MLRRPIPSSGELLPVIGVCSVALATDYFVQAAPSPTPLPISPLPVVVVTSVSDAVKIALIGSVTTAVVSLFGVAVSLFNAHKAIEIHTLTNGNLHTVEATNKVLMEKVDNLQAQLVEAMRTGKLAASTAAQAATAASQAATDVRTAQSTHLATDKG